MPFRDIVGHRRLVDLVARSVQRGTLPPSLLFAGPEGVGKRLLAVSTAQAVNCLNPGAPGPHRDVAAAVDACGECSACARVWRGVHPDVLLLQPSDTGSIKIEQVREIIDRANYRPFEGRRRVVIVDDADALVPQAQNALLKTLEEPPPSSMFVLITARPDMLLPTVLSRCPRLRFGPLDAGEVASVLMKRGVSEPEARAVAATADGSVAHALQASAADLVEAREVALRVLARAAATSDPRPRLDSAKDLLARTGSSAAADRAQVAVHLRAMASLLRDAELLATVGDGRTIANRDVPLDRLSAYGGERGIRAFAAVDQALAAIDRNAGVKVVADWLVLQL